MINRTLRFDRIMAKIQRVKSYRYKDHDIYRYRLDIPADFLKELGWTEKTHVEFKTKNKKLVVSKSL